MQVTHSCLPQGAGEEFFLDILFYRMSQIASILRQLRSRIVERRAATLTGNETLGGNSLTRYLLVCDHFLNRGKQNIETIMLFHTCSSEPP
jgi:hypothetical protein